MGDADGDGDVDRADFAAFAAYVAGPSADPQLSGWHFFDVDMDDDVDLGELAVWQNGFTGPLRIRSLTRPALTWCAMPSPARAVTTIPTVDGWGLAILSLLLATGAKIRFRRG